MNRRGILLVFVSGFLVVLALAGVLLLNLGRFSRAGAEAALAADVSALTAESGMHYASARLAAGTLSPDGRRVSTRGDDWSFRDGVAAEHAGALNPSYSHGEGWSESGGRPGVFDLNADDLSGWTDLDGDGRFSAWSGRLRNGGRPFGAVFALKIVSPEGKLPVNAGALDAADVHGPRMPPAGLPGQEPTAQNGKGDHKDPEIPCHRGLVHALDNLGALLLPEGTHRWETPPAVPDAEAFRWSRLGSDLLAFRPPGGYGTLEDVRKALLGAGYVPAEWEAVAPFIDVGPYVGCGFEESGRVVGYETSNLPRYVPVNLRAAPPEVLEALWTKLATFVSMAKMPGSPAGWDAPCTRAGKSLAFKNLQPTAGGAYAMIQIYPDEARNAIGTLDDLRHDGTLSWRTLRREFLDSSADLFPVDHADLSAVAPDLARSWCQAKADLLFLPVSPDPGGLQNLLEVVACAWAGWEIDRDPAPGVQQMRALPFQAITRLKPSPGPEEGWFTGPLTPFKYCESNGATPNPPFLPWGGTLAPPVRFSVSSTGSAPGGPARRVASGEILAAERLEFVSQEDFENLGGGKNLARRGILTWDPAPFLRRDVRFDVTTYEDGAAPRLYPHVVTLPFREIRSVTGNEEGEPPWWGFSRGIGGLALAGREGGLQGARLYWAVKEDGDNRLNNQGVRTPGPEGELWHERAPGFSPEPAKPLPVDLSTTETRWNPYSVEAETKYQRVGGFDWSFQCPGMTGVPEVDLIQAFSVEAWMKPGSSLAIYGSYPAGVPGMQKPPPLVGLSVTRDEALLENAFRLTVNGYEPTGGSPILRTSGAVFSVGDAAVTQGSAWNFHVLLSVRRIAPNETRFSLYLNGMDAAGGPPLEHVHPYSIVVQDKEALGLVGIDEIRLHDTALDRPSAEARFRLGRFVSGGTWKSSLYVLDAPTRFVSGQWTGFVPASFTDSARALAVRVTGYSDPAGGVEIGTVPLADADKPTDLEALRGIRSFRYEVAFDASEAAVVTETPVLDSVWFCFRRRGRTNAWTVWE